MRKLQLPLPRTPNRDRRRDLNTFDGLPDRAIHQVPRGSQAYRLGAGAGDEFLQRREFEIPRCCASKDSQDQRTACRSMGPACQFRWTVFRPPEAAQSNRDQATSRVYWLNHAIVRVQASSAATWL